MAVLLLALLWFYITGANSSTAISSLSGVLDLIYRSSRSSFYGSTASGTFVVL